MSGLNNFESLRNLQFLFMKKLYALFYLSVFTFTAQAQDLIFDASFNNDAAYRDDLPSLIGVGVGNTYYQDFGKLRQVNDSIFIYYINVANYDSETYDCQARAIISHSDGTATHEQVFSAAGSFTGASPEDWSITDIITNQSNGHVYIVQNGLFDDSGTTRKCVNVHGREFDAVNGNFQIIPLWGQNQSGKTEISLAGSNIRSAKGTIMAGVPFLAMCLEGAQSTNVATSAVISNGQGFSFTGITANANTLHSVVSDVVAISSTEVYIADNAYTYTYVNPSVQINDYARILKFNPTTNALDQSYGNGNGIAIISWNSQSNTNFVQDQIKRILYVGGDLYVAGYSREDIGAQYTPVHGKVTLLDNLGNVDNSFASTGTFAPDYSSTRFRTYFNDIDLAGDGSLYLSGSGSVTNSPNDPTTSFILALNDNGTVQTSKGTNGFLFESTDFYDINESIIIPGTSALTDKFVFNGYFTSMPAETAVGRLIWSNSVNALTENVQPSLNIYPNPVKDILNVTSTEKCTIEIRNSLGKLIQHVQVAVGTTSVSVEKLPAGMYFIQVEGTSMTSLRFVKQ